MVRITYHGQRVNINSGLKILPSSWDSKRQRVKGSNEQAKLANHYLQTTQIRVLGIYDELMRLNQPFTVYKIRDKFLGKGEITYTLLEVVENHNAELKRLVGKTYAISTYMKYHWFQVIVTIFLSEFLRKTHLTINEIDISIIKKFEHFLLTERNCNHNSATKRLQQLKKVLRFARISGFTSVDPFDSYPLKVKPTHRTIITKEELSKIESFEPQTESLRQLKDIFLFQCYTGLSHVDLQKLHSSNIQKGVDNTDWIYMNRTKTNTPIKIPLLPLPQSILLKYQHYSVKNQGRLLPVPTNQVMNRSLKILAKILGINKQLTTHMARHCFATTVTLSNGVPIEIVSKLLAHTNIRTTQIYAKVLDGNILEAMDKLKDRLK
jgi:site-specific recombinase XerD